MAGNKLTIKLTDEQQSQIRTATGKSITEFNINIGQTENLSDKELDNVAGGAFDVYLKE
jgi:bacteriocin-like protein